VKERERIIRTLRGESVDKLAWATRLDIWYVSRQREGTLPPELSSMELSDIHRYVGVGRQRYSTVAMTRLHKVDMVVEVDGIVTRRESNPVLQFPAPREYAVSDRPVETVLRWTCPAGSVRVRYKTIVELVRGAALPYMMEHCLKDDDDFQVLKWMLNHAEIETTYDDFIDGERVVGENGFTIGMIPRIPFQRILLDFMGEETAFYWMADSPRSFGYLLDILTDQDARMVDSALRSPALMIEYGDNFDGSITSPRLFRQYAMNILQRTAEMTHARGKFLGSHMDGDMKPLVQLVPECGLDVVESFSPAPLTRLEFGAAWDAWRDKVLIWGGVPSTIFESHVSEAEFDSWLAGMFAHIGSDGRIILGIGDQAVGPTLIERVRRLSQMLGR
jgi:hypothetical protein